MSLVPTLCDGAAGSATPPDPCAPSGAATSDAPITVADHRAQCLIPTSVEGRSSLASTYRKPYIHVAAGSGFIIAPLGRVDNHRTHICPVEQVVEAHERAEAHASHRAVPSQPQVPRPPRPRAGRERVVHDEPGRVGLLELRPASVGEPRARRPTDTQ